jgi:hypothetical protein
MNRTESVSCQNIFEFLAYVRSSLLGRSKQYHGELDDYLRSLLSLVEEHHAQPVTYSLLASLLRDAFDAPPVQFDASWLAYAYPPLDQEPALTPLERLRRMLRYQIADWHRMRESGILENEYRYFGIDSPTGNRWYNFSPEEFLECGTAGMGFDRTEDMSEDEYVVLHGGIDLKGRELPESGKEIPPSWDIVTDLLWMGQIYE